LYHHLKKNKIMKSTFLTLALVFCSLYGFSQSVFRLDANGLGIPQFTTNPSFTVADKGKLIFNTTDNKLYYCDGTAWIAPTATPAPSLYSIAGNIAGIPFGGANAPWIQAGPSVTVTVNGQQTITANMVGVVGHTNANPQPLSFCACYQQQNGANPPGANNPFFSTTYPDATAAASPNKTVLAAAALVQPTAGTYKIFFCVKNKATNVNFGANDFVNGTVIVF
jgi:hypothetical protein